jgi:hypothetical protein
MNRNFFRTCSTIGALAALAACGESAVGPNSNLSPSGPSFTASVPFNNNAACMGDDAVAAPDNTVPGVKNGSDPLSAANCTSQDVKVARTDLISYRLGDENGNFSGIPIPYTGQEVSCTRGQAVELTLTAELDETSTSTRHDIGIWIATDGGEAVSGQCNHYNLVEGGTVTDNDGDSCGDLTDAADVTGFELGTITTICQVDPTPVPGSDATQLHIGSCLGWTEPGANRTCPVASTADGAGGFRWGTLHGNQAKCNCDGFNVDITVLESAFLEVQKVCEPTTDGGLFNLQIDGTTEAADAACGGTTGKKAVGAGDSESDPPGQSHTFGETAGTSTALTDYTSTRECHNRGEAAGNRLSSAAGTGGTLTLQPDDDVVCTITNTRKGSVVIIKDAVPDDAQDFSFTSDITGSTAFDLDDDGDNANTLSNTKTITGLTPGTYTVTEAAASGWDLTNITCVDPTTNSSGVIGTGVATINVAAGETVTCTYTNTKKGSIVIIKDAVPDHAQDFAFTSTISGNASFDLDDDGDNANTLSNTKTINNVTPGSYTVTEGATTGWDLTSLVCVDATSNTTINLGTRTASINIAAAETVTCTYTNTQRASLTLNKVENGGLPLSRPWAFELRTGTSTTQAGTLVANGSTNQTTGVVTFPGTFIPGSYNLCETGMPATWTNNFTGYTPLGATPEGGDNSTECIDITLVSGANGPGGITGVPNPIDNVLPPPPGGDARTIGYWKNWSSCTGGRQYEKAAALNELNKTLNYYLPTGSALYPIGDITGTPALTCLQAVRLLGKSDMNTGKKYASDPAYNLAAQFIAAKLNLAAGAETCTAVTTAIASAQTLLDAINFTGTGQYKSMSKANATLANQLAATLDSYNNNTLCT